MPHPDRPTLLYTTCGFAPEQVGGVEQHTLEVARELDRRGINVGFFTRGERPDLEEGDCYEQPFEGIPVTRTVYRWGRCRTVRHIYDHESQAAVFSRFLEQARPRGAHVHHLSGLGLSCLDSLKKAGLPFVMTLHDYWMICPRGQMFHSDLYPCDEVDPVRCAPCIGATWPHLMPSRGAPPFSDQVPAGDDRASIEALHQWIREKLTLPARLITASAAARDRIVAFGVPEHRIEVVEYGQDTAPFLGIVRKPSQRVRFGFVGTLYPSKGAHILLEAFAALEPGSASLLLAGNSPPFHQCLDYMDRIKALIEKIPAENPVELLGTYRHEDLPGLLARIDVLVVPPVWNEAYGLTLREGMLAGCAAVASRVGGLPQAIEEGVNGFTFPKDDAGALAAVLSRFTRDRGLASRLGAHPTPVRTIDDMVNRLVAIYREVGIDL